MRTYTQIETSYGHIVFVLGSRSSVPSAEAAQHTSIFFCSTKSTSGLLAEDAQIAPLYLNSHSTDPFKLGEACIGCYLTKGSERDSPVVCWRMH